MGAGGRIVGVEGKRVGRGEELRESRCGGEELRESRCGGEELRENGQRGRIEGEWAEEKN